MIQFPLCGTFDSLDTRLQVVTEFGHAVQGVRTTCIGPLVWEGDFFGGALLEQKFMGKGVEEEDGEGAVEETFLDIGH
jgi:hypothetical protein